MIDITIGQYLIPFEWFIAPLLLLSLIYCQVRKKHFGISPFHPASLIATCFNIGRLKPAPGTWGSLFGLYLLLLIALAPRKYNMSPEVMISLTLSATIVLYFLGVWATKHYMEITGRSDPKEVVIDEVIGLFFSALCCIALYSLLLLTGNREFFFILALTPFFIPVLFLLFRIYDASKVWHIGWIDRNVKDAHGVILDDVVAGIYAAITFFLLFLLIYFTGVFHAIFESYYPDWMDQGAIRTNAAS